MKYSNKEFNEFVEEINEKIRKKGIKIACYEAYTPLHAYIWRIIVKKGEYIYYEDLADKRLAELQNDIYVMLRQNCYTEIHIEVVKKCINDAVSFINEDERYEEACKECEKADEECTIIIGDMLISLIEHETRIKLDDYIEAREKNF